MSGTPSSETVACLGSSTTASRGTYKWIDELEKRPQNRRFRFVNLGVGGDLSFNAVRRLDRVIALRPDRVIVLIGTNDVMASVFPSFRRFARVWKRLSEEPSPARFEQNLAIIVHRLHGEAGARVGLSSLAPLGEEPGSSHPVQERLNDLIATYNGIIRNVASTGSAHYIPFYEAFLERLARATTTKPFTRFSFASLYRDYLWREMVMRQSFDEISRSNGWHFHVDGIHLNTAGGRILTDTVQQFLDA
ncbi:SGNH/GDSL hydrolase family protein [Mycobacterium terramassiliense]|uniref:Lysophospholipase L1 or related esterase n=1 Tax=Mycobacterium terramassiliense TaxID=1841859 RepID=A0A2U3NKE2_9MYCO|nr:GDSL-type esterase/lipase family protein [Mycobacterium terramassiliense]SPM31998.1 Lysophospholipase L1 or related esterase [Mycobacterium terramassiliense]